MESEPLLFPVSCKCCCLSFQPSVNGIILCSHRADSTRRGWPHLLWVQLEKGGRNCKWGSLQFQFAFVSQPIAQLDFLLLYLKANRTCKAKLVFQKTKLYILKRGTHGSFMSLTPTLVADAFSAPPICPLPSWMTSYVSLRTFSELGGWRLLSPL